MAPKNLFAARPALGTLNPEHPKPPCERSLRMLEAMPGYWKGRAFTRRQLAKMLRDSGDAEAGKRHDREANKYEAIAEGGLPSAPRVDDEIAHLARMRGVLSAVPHSDFGA